MLHCFLLDDSSFLDASFPEFFSSLEGGTIRSSLEKLGTLLCFVSRLRCRERVKLVTKDKVQPHRERATTSRGPPDHERHRSRPCQPGGGGPRGGFLVVTQRQRRLRFCRNTHYPHHSRPLPVCSPGRGPRGRLRHLCAARCLFDGGVRGPVRDAEGKLSIRAPCDCPLRPGRDYGQRENGLPLTTSTSESEWGSTFRTLVRLR